MRYQFTCLEGVKGQGRAGLQETLGFSFLECQMPRNTSKARFTPEQKLIGMNFGNKSGTNVCTGDFAPLEPGFRAEFWETNFGRPNFGPEFLGRIF